MMISFGVDNNTRSPPKPESYLSERKVLIIYYTKFVISYTENI